MKVLHVINSMIVGGAETLLKDAIIGIKQKYPDLEQYLVTLYGGGKMLDPIMDIVLYKDLKVNNYNFLYKVFEFNQFIKDHQIDVVHAHLYDAMILARLSVPNSVKLLYTYHSGLHHPKSNDYSWIRSRLDRITYRKKHIAIFVSEAVKTCVICGVYIKGPSYVIYNFTSLKFNFQYKLKNDQTLKLVSVGNLRTAKNHENSIEILASLINYPVCLDIYGNGSLQGELEKQIKRKKAKVKIITNSFLTSEILCQYDLFFMSSFQEGMSVALIEAMTSGLPSLLSNIDSFRETGKNSAIYFDLNSIDDAKDKLLNLLQNKNQLRQMSLNAKELSTKYSFSLYFDKIMELYTI